MSKFLAVIGFKKIIFNNLENKFNCTIKRNIKTSNTKLNARAYEINTNVNKDVILFKYENLRFFKLLNIFALSQFGFWSYLSHFAFTTLRDAPCEVKDVDLPWYKRINMGENKYRNTLTIFSFLIGYGILTASWLFTLRSVKYLILHKGGQEISLVMYTPLGKNRIMKVPIKCVSAQESRMTARVQLPLKIKNKSFYYILDMKGEFLNKSLFDYTVGLKRQFN